MVWWLFSRKREVKIHPHIKRIESTLKNSFNNIKTDISAISSHIIKHSDHIKDIHKRLDYIEQNISILHNKIESDLGMDSDEEFITNNKEKIVDNLTTVQRTILLRLANLQIESEEPWISTKNLTEDIYPEKEYNQIRPMMSDYLNILLDFGLINKVRKRRQTYISLSKKALYFISKNKQKKLIKVIKKH